MAVYILSPTTEFHTYHGAYLHWLCMQADGQTDGQDATDKEYTLHPSQEENIIAIAINVIWC